MLYPIISLISKLRDSLRAIQKSIEKIGGTIDAAAAEYHAEKNAERGTPVTVSILRTSESIADEKIACKARERTEQRDRKRLQIETAALWIGAIVAFANIGLWIQTYEATRIAAISAKAAQEGAKAAQAGATAAAGQTEAAEASVAATRQSIQASIPQFRLDQRAWVTVEQRIDTTPLANGGPVAFAVKVKNTGKTPALEMHSLITARTWGNHEKFRATYLPPEDTAGSFVLEPGGETLLPTTGPPLTPQLDAIHSGSKILYVYGEITYLDIFERPHITRFCMLFKPNLIDVHYCPTHNSAN